jgi:hypothetical protein
LGGSDEDLTQPIQSDHEEAPHAPPGPAHDGNTVEDELLADREAQSDEKKQDIPDREPRSADADDCIEAPACDPAFLPFSTRPRVMQVVPRGLRSLWIKLCERHFERLLAADANDDDRGRAQALHAILSNPRLALQLPADRGTQTYKQWINAVKLDMRRELSEMAASSATGGGHRALVASLSLAPMPDPSSADDRSDLALHNGANHSSAAQQSSRSLRTRDDHAVRLAQSKAYQGYISKAFAALGSKGAHGVNAESIAKMRALHPPAEAEAMPECPQSTPRIAIDLDKLVEVIRHIDNGSAPGVSGWSGDHVAQLISNNKCLRGVGVVVRLIMNKEVPEEMRNTLLVVPLTDLRKGEDGCGHRPVAPGEIFYRIAARYALSLTPDNVMRSLFPTMQYGANQSCGTERALHLIRTARTHINKGITIKIDIENAFNTLSRSHIAKVLYARPELSHLWRLFDFAYGKPSPLIMYERGEARAQLESAKGVRQGDALGSFLFCLAIQPALQQSRGSTRSSRCLTVAFVDDATIIGSTADALNVFQRLRAAFAEIGLSLAVSKCSVMFNGAAAETMPGHDRDQVRRAGLSVVNQMVAMGCCISEDDTLIHKWTKGLLAEAEAQCRQLAHPAMRTQCAMLLLRMSMNARMDFIIRALPPQHSLPLMKDFDELVMQTFFRIAEIEPPDDAAERERLTHRLQLPTSMGGLGLISKAAIAPIAWYASLRSAVVDVLAFHGGDVGAAKKSRLHVEIADAETEIIETNPQYELKLPANVSPCNARAGERSPMWTTAALQLRGARAARRSARDNAIDDGEAMRAPPAQGDVPPHLQRALSEQHHQKRRERFLQALRQSHRNAERASLLSASQRNAALWLTALPKDPRFRLRDEEMRHALRLRLHLPPREPDRLRTTTCPCGNGDLKQDPLHFQSCALLKRTAITTRHDLVLQTLSTLAGELGVPRTVEPRPLQIVGEDGEAAERPSRLKPDLLLITANHRAAELLTDVAIAHPAAESSLALGSAMRPLSAAKDRETRKERKYGHLVRDAQPGTRELKAFVMESFGAFGAHADHVLKVLLKHAVRDDDDDTPQLIDARTRLSIALQRGNACIAHKGIEILSTARRLA